MKQVTQVASKKGNWVAGGQGQKEDILLFLNVDSHEHIMFYILLYES